MALLAFVCNLITVPRGAFRAFNSREMRFPAFLRYRFLKKSIPTPSHRNVAKHLIACRGYFRFLILYLNEALQCECGVCLPKRCRAQACFRKTFWNFLYFSYLARGAQGSAIAQWRAAASPRFSLRTICGKKIIGIRKIAAALLYFAVLFFAEHIWSFTKCHPLFSFPMFILA